MRGIHLILFNKSGIHLSNLQSKIRFLTHLQEKELFKYRITRMLSNAFVADPIITSEMGKTVHHSGESE